MLGMVLATGVAQADMLDDLLAPSNGATIECSKSECHIYLTDEIKGPDYYIEQYKVLAKAKATDVVYIHLAGPGGQGDGLVYLINAIKSSKAKVVSVVDGNIASADAVLAIVNKDYIINGDVQVLFHSISTTGMTEEICRNQSGSDRGLSTYSKCIEDLPKMTDFYNSVINKYVLPLLTTRERTDYLNGHDIIIDGKELKKRLDSLYHFKKYLQDSSNSLNGK